MVIEIDYSDPVVRRMLAVNEAANASFAERAERTTAEHAQSMTKTIEESKQKIKESRAAYAGKRRRPEPKEDPHKWPEREKKNRVLSFGDDEAKPVPPPAPKPPPPPPRPAPRPEPKPPAPERPHKGRVLNFSTEDDEDEGFQGFRRRR